MFIELLFSIVVMCSLRCVCCDVFLLFIFDVCVYMSGILTQTRRYPELEKEFYDMLEKELGFQLLFDIDISGTVESMYGSSESERAAAREGSGSGSTGRGSGDEDPHDQKKFAQHTGTGRRHCTSDTILHAYTLSAAASGEKE